VGLGYYCRVGKTIYAWYVCVAGVGYVCALPPMVCQQIRLTLSGVRDVEDVKDCTIILILSSKNMNVIWSLVVGHFGHWMV